MEGISEGSQWESCKSSSYFQLDNLIEIIDVNRLGQRGQTMYGHDLTAYEKRFSDFGGETFRIDGHFMPGIPKAHE